jgi:hypothetical protein
VLGTKNAVSSFKFAGLDWENVRAQPAPEMVQPAADSVVDTEVDWGLRSMAESLPLRYVYDSNTTLPSPSKGRGDQLS